MTNRKRVGEFILSLPGSKVVNCGEFDAFNITRYGLTAYYKGERYYGNIARQLFRRATTEAEVIVVQSKTFTATFEFKPKVRTANEPVEDWLADVFKPIM